MEIYDPKGFVWQEPNCPDFLKLITEGHAKGWVCCQHIDGQWVTLRKPTPEDWHNAFVAMTKGTR